MCEIRSRNKRKHLPICVCNGLVDDVSVNIITLHKLFVSNVIETHDTLLGFVKALTMRIRLHSYSQPGLTIQIQTVIVNSLQYF